MTAAQAREELEAAIWRAMAEQDKCHTAAGKCQRCTARVREALSIADAYAGAFAASQIDKAAAAYDAALGPNRLARAAAEAARRTP